MSDLYVANLTKQKFTFYYRVPEEGKEHARERFENIEPGTQVKIPGDLTTEQRAYIIDSHKPYGMTDANEIKNRRKFTGLCFSVGKEIPLDTFLERYEANDAALEKQGNERMTLSAAAIGDRLRRVSNDAPLKRASVEQIEEKKGTVARGVEIVEPGNQPNHPEAKQAR